MSDDVFRLIYCSRSQLPAQGRRAVLGEIFSAARANNKRLRVTGALLVSDNRFAQALEGHDERTVRRLYDHISRDPRHTDVSLIDERTLDEYTFGRWSMAWVGRDGDVDIPLITNRDRGGIVRRASEPVDADQETVLDFMRDAIRES